MSDTILPTGIRHMKRQPIVYGVSLFLAIVSASYLAAQSPTRRRLHGDTDKVMLIKSTEAALINQIKCKQSPQVGRAINAMLKKNLIRYFANESGIYLFKPSVPLKFLGFKVIHISGFEYDGFIDVPTSRMTGTSPPVFLEIDVVASASELRRRALEAGLVEAVHPDKHGFELSTEGLATYLADEPTGAISSIRCVDDFFAHPSR